MLTVSNSDPAQAVCEVGFTRLFDAPRALVFQVWTEPKHMAKWWGPKVFTTRVQALDAHPGGSIHLIMRAPDGIDYPMTGTFQEVDPPEKLVMLTQAVDGQGRPILESLITVTFVEEGRKTKLTVHAKACSLAPAGVQALRGMEMGWAQSLERLEGYLGDAQPHAGQDPVADREIVTTRFLHAPRELVFRVWTEPQHISQWWGPRGFTNSVHAMDVRSGGVWSYTMHGPDGTDYPGLISYLEVIPPEKLVYWLGDDANPQMFLSTVTFDDWMGDTYLTMRGVFPSAAKRIRVVEQKYGAIEGAISTLDCLEEYLKQVGSEQMLN